ncbi:hypothetical protein GM661_16695 [Iocasia frigidifontis]|uniref:SCP domain-containing protein n=1 Tax=Iocasia fonsfrigidae TaxID=2682810 RepID=A0A8A7KKV0_9FIRM|nr:CAP domain-containing protein [Iocasia fonsfrigidae]QTL99467.1 hypothetical protein GM661_16695 [Iocasia fonsfrigidae]
MKTKCFSVFLIIILLVNFMFLGFPSLPKAEAGFFNEHKDSIYTVVKGLIMLWIFNLIRDNATGSGSDDIITSTIKKGLNIDLDDAVADEGETIEIDSEETEDNPVSNYKGVSIGTKEKEMIDIINEIRQERGLNPLEVDNRLVYVARKKAQDMVDNNYFDHQSPNYGSPFEMIKSQKINYSLAGENLAGAATINKAVDSLMSSPEHRGNILKARYDKVGIGIIEDGPYGLMIVQLFIDSPDPAE